MKSISYWVIKKIVDKYPNDKELGKEIREYISNYEG